MTTTSLGERLRWARWRRGLTQHELARELGIATCTLQKLESGRAVKDARVLAAVGSFLEDADWNMKTESP
jgi:transcriptional regulator with XRE-family HTH domain